MYPKAAPLPFHTQIQAPLINTQLCSQYILQTIIFSALLNGCEFLCCDIWRMSTDTHTYKLQASLQYSRNCLEGEKPSITITALTTLFFDGNLLLLQSHNCRLFAGAGQLGPCEHLIRFKLDYRINHNFLTVFFSYHIFSTFLINCVLTCKRLRKSSKTAVVIS